MGGRNIFAKVDSSWTDMRHQFFKRDKLLLCEVSTIIYYDVNDRDIAFKFFPKTSVCLISNNYRYSLGFVSAASFFNVHTPNMAAVTEIMFPHAKTAPAVNPNFNNINFASCEFAYVSLIYVEVMHPFPNSGADIVG